MYLDVCSGLYFQVHNILFKSVVSNLLLRNFFLNYSFSYLFCFLALVIFLKVFYLYVISPLPIFNTCDSLSNPFYLFTFFLVFKFLLLFNFYLKIFFLFIHFCIPSGLAIFSETILYFPELCHIISELSNFNLSGFLTGDIGYWQSILKRRCDLFYGPIYLSF